MKLNLSLTMILFKRILISIFIFLTLSFFTLTKTILISLMKLFFSFLYRTHNLFILLRTYSLRSFIRWRRTRLLQPNFIFKKGFPFIEVFRTKSSFWNNQIILFSLRLIFNFSKSFLIQKIILINKRNSLYKRKHWKSVETNSYIMISCLKKRNQSWTNILKK